jgi:PPOX class probable F420-dependent enzyme
MSTEIPESHRGMIEAHITAVLTTVGADGTPQSTAIWYLAEDDVVRTSLLETRQKVRNLRRNPTCTLFLIDPANPFKTLEVRGEAELELDIDRVFTHKIIRAYGMDPETFPDELTVDRYVFTLRPSHIVAFGA